MTKGEHHHASIFLPDSVFGMTVSGALICRGYLMNGDGNNRLAAPAGVTLSGSAPTCSGKIF
jgi:hypothetical protein